MKNYIKKQFKIPYEIAINRSLLANTNENSDTYAP